MMRRVLLGVGVMVALAGCSEDGVALDTTNEMTYRSSAAVVSQAIEDPDTRVVFEVAVMAIYRHVSEMNGHLVERMNANAAYSRRDIAEAYEVYQSDLDQLIGDASVEELIENSSDLIGAYFNDAILQPRQEEEAKLQARIEYSASMLEKSERALDEDARGLAEQRLAYQGDREFTASSKALIEDAVSYELLPLDQERVSLRIMNDSDFPTARYQGPVTISNDRIRLNTYLNIAPVMPGEIVVTRSEPGRMHWSSRGHGNEAGIEILRKHGFRHGLNLVSGEQKEYLREYNRALSSNDGLIRMMEAEQANRRASLEAMKSELMEKKATFLKHQRETRRLMSVFGRYMG